ncbi:hypothetical protein ACWA5Z_06620 [Testudinibacter sp. P80/BLE/0925]
MIGFVMIFIVGLSVITSAISVVVMRKDIGYRWWEALLMFAYLTIYVVAAILFLPFYVAMITIEGLFYLGDGYFWREFKRGLVDYPSRLRAFLDGDYLR